MSLVLLQVSVILYVCVYTHICTHMQSIFPEKDPKERGDYPASWRNDPLFMPLPYSQLNK